MMDSMQELLGKYSQREPVEITAIKQYIQEHFGTDSSVGIRGNVLVVTVASSALANTLRFHIGPMREAAQTNRRIIFRIG